MLFACTAKVMLEPSVESAELFLETIRANIRACNFVSEHIFETHTLAITTLNKNLYRQLRERFGLRSQMAQSVIRTVVARYKTILENEHKWIKPVFKKGEYDLVWNRDYSLKNGVFSVNTLDGRAKTGYHDNAYVRQYFDGWKFGTAKLICRHKKWYLHIPVSKEVETLADADVSNIVGVDLGINFLATTYDSEGKTEFFDGRFVKQKRAHYKELRRELQQVGTPSAKRKLNAIGQRENRWMQDVNHCVSKALVEKNPTGTLFVLEDLTGIRAATEKVRKADRYMFVSWAFNDFGQKLEYKAVRNGQKVIKVDPSYTSQTCPKCGHIEKSNRNKKLHEFKCKNCGYTSNDDRVGAMNLHRKGIEYLYAVTTGQAS